MSSNNKNNKYIFELRRNAARELTKLIDSHKIFSFIRLGDGEVWWLLEVQEGRSPPKYSYYQEQVSGVERTASTSGLEAKYYNRFKEAIENATYLDLCNNIPYVAENISKVKMERSPGLYQNGSPETANIIFEWTSYEFPEFIKNHNCLIASAESRLFEALCNDSEYLKITRDYIPDTSRLVFHQIRDDGRNYSENLKLIKNDLKELIKRNNIDTLFLSLSTGAKILCYELANELNVRCIDFGSMTRALTYSGSPGYQSIRNLHNPFLFRVPLPIYISALRNAYPGISQDELMSRTQSQILLDLQDLKPFSFNTSDAITGKLAINKQNLDLFRCNMKIYRNMFGRNVELSGKSILMDKEFRKWILKHKITFTGKIFVSLVKVKGVLRKLLAPTGIIKSPVNRQNN